jgi:hypothetical protein
MFWRFRQADQFARPTELPHLLQKSLLSPAALRFETSRYWASESSAGGKSKDERTTTNSRNIDRQKTEALGNDWAAPVC